MTYGEYKFNLSSSRSKIQFCYNYFAQRIPLHQQSVLPCSHSWRSVTTIGGRTGIGSGGNSAAGSVAGTDGIVSTGTVDHLTFGGGGELTGITEGRTSTFGYTEMPSGICFGFPIFGTTGSLVGCAGLLSG
jgi:hypothetical protein